MSGTASELLSPRAVLPDQEGAAVLVGRPGPEAGVSGAGRQYLPEVDGLRALAAFGVLAFHYGIEVHLPFFPIGWAGVWLFYVLSGFVITRMLVMSGWRLSAGSYVAFSLRRVARIWPLYYGFLILFVGTSSLLKWHAPHLAALFGFMSFTSNFQLSDRHYAHIGYLWTLSVEQQFYLLFPLVFEAARRLGARVFGGLIVAGILCRAGLAWWFHDIGLSPLASGQIIYFLSPAHVDAFGVGALIAFAGADRLRRGILCITGVLLVACVSLITCRLILNPAGPHLGLHGAWQVLIPYVLPPPHGDGAMVWMYLLAVALSASLLVIALARGSRLGRFLSLRLLVRSGRVSYGVYVWHGVIVQGVAAAIAGPAAPLWLRIAGLPVTGAATLTVAAASYRFYETRFHRAFRRGVPRDRRSPPRAVDAIPETRQEIGEAV